MEQEVKERFIHPEKMADHEKKAFSKKAEEIFKKMQEAER